jgi:hypothetical protein
VSLVPSSTDPDRISRPAPRYLPDEPLPRYRYLPGVDPHPRRDPCGHSYERVARLIRHPDWRPEAWPELSAWLRGVDLFNALYFWEAHESWEALWAAKPKESAPALLLQGLIQVAAALLKIRLGSVRGASVLSQEGLEKIARVARERPHLLGLDLNQVERDFSNYFRPLEQRTLPPIDASVPMLALSGVART